MCGSRHLRCLLLLALASGLRAEDKSAAEPAKTGNWLVEGVTGKADGSPGDTLTGVRASDVASARAASRSATQPDESAVNPLSSYLSAWMTPRDLELLKDKEPGTHTPGVTSTAGRPAVRTTQGAHTNPYLVDSSSGPAEGVKPPPLAPAPKPPASLVTEVKTDVAPAKTPGPPAEVLKAQEDAKYFPQQKRF